MRILIFIILLAGLVYSTAFAVTPSYLDKPKVRLSILPGATEYGDIVITNPSNETRPMRLYLEDWYYLPAGDGSKEFVPANSTPYSCTSWITFSPAEFTLVPFGRQRVSYSIKAPPEAKGSYYAVLFFENLVGEVGVEGQKGVGGGLNIVLRVGTLFYSEVKGTTQQTGNVESPNLKKDKTTGNFLIETDFHNTGNTDITAGGSFHIMDKKGLIYARGEFNDVYTFPGNTAKLKSEWKEAIPKGKYDLVLTIDISKAQAEAGLNKQPVIIREAEIELGEKGEVIKVGELK